MAAKVIKPKKDPVLESVKSSLLKNLVQKSIPSKLGRPRFIANLKSTLKKPKNILSVVSKSKSKLGSRGFGKFSA